MYNEQEKFMVMIAEELIKYKNKYKETLQELEYQKNLNDTKRNTIKSKFKVIDKFENVKEKIHPILNQNIEGNKKTTSTIDELIENAVTNSLKGDAYLKSILSNEEIYFKKNDLIATGRDNELKNTVTKFINNFFLGTDDKFYNMLISFYTFASKALTKYITKKEAEIRVKYPTIRHTYNFSNNIFLVFKGGNMLKAIYQKYKYEVPGKLSDKINELFNKYFSRSDLDFEVVIDKDFSGNNVVDKQIYEELVDNIELLMYCTLTEFKKTYVNNLEEFFNYYKNKNIINILHLATLKKELNENLKELQNPSNFKKFIADYGEYFRYYETMEITNVIFNDLCTNKEELIVLENENYDNFINPEYVKNIMTNSFYNFRNDMYVDDINKLTLVKFINTPEKNEFYSTFIKTIEVNRGLMIRTFCLTRTKINFLAQYTTNDKGSIKYGLMNIPGELIDVSIARFDDYRTVGNIHTKYLKYKLDCIDNNKIFEFYSYNFTNLIFDIFSIIYIDIKCPWDDIKYEKRLYRLLFMSIIEILSIDSAEIANFLNLLKTISTESTTTITNDNNYFSTKLASYTDNKIKNCTFYKILEKHTSIKSNVVRTTEDKFTKYYEIIQKFLKEIDPIIDLIKNFCANKEPGKINVLDADFRNLHQIGGKKMYVVKNKNNI
jgi:sulfur transfer complex TusBCD TusB component (DsrH family)